MIDDYLYTAHINIENYKVVIDIQFNQVRVVAEY